MSDELIEIKAKLHGFAQEITSLTQMISIKQYISTFNEDMDALPQRADNFEGMIDTNREGFQSLQHYLEDLNYVVADNERATRLLRRRVARLERKNED
jgi:uncharacterized coiled-coil DUF342 family protein